MDINIFKHVKDTRWGIAKDYTWNEIREVLPETIYVKRRDHVPLFNLVRYKTEDDPDVNRGNDRYGSYVTRGMSNAIDIGALIYDFDNEPRETDKSGIVSRDTQRITVEQIIDRFREYEYLLYPSWNHKRCVLVGEEVEKRGRKVIAWDKSEVPVGEGIDRFRVVLPFAVPCPIEEWMQRTDAMKGFCGDTAASESYDPVHIYYLSAWQKGIDEATGIVRNTGRFLDWRAFEKNKIEVVPEPLLTERLRPSMNGSGRGGGYDIRTFDIQRFLIDKELFRGIKARGNSGRWNACICPLHHLHTKGDEYAYYLQGADGWGFRCHHTTHGELDSKAFIKIFGWDEIKQYCHKSEAGRFVEGKIQRRQKRLEDIRNRLTAID